MPQEILRKTDFIESPIAANSYKACFLMKIWPRTGLFLRGIIQPTLKEPPCHQIPHGSYINVDWCPIKLLPDCVMMNYLKVRYLAPKGSLLRNHLIKLIQDI